MVEAIVAGGHEIGLHGYLHEKLASLSEAEEEAILLPQRFTELLATPSPNPLTALNNDHTVSLA